MFAYTKNVGLEGLGDALEISTNYRLIEWVSKYTPLSMTVISG